MPGTFVLLAIFVVLVFLAIQLAKVTRVTLIVLFVVALGSGVTFLSLGLRGHV